MRERRRACLCPMVLAVVMATNLCPLALCGRTPFQPPSSSPSRPSSTTTSPTTTTPVTNSDSSKPSTSPSSQDVSEDPADIRFYDETPVMYSPSGRVLQIEYAIQAVAHGKPILGIRTPQGVVLAGRKTVMSPKLQVLKLRQKLFQIDDHIMVAATGITADAYELVRYARDKAQSYLRLWGEPIPVRVLVEELCNLQHSLGSSVSRSRIFGVSLLVAGWDEAKGHQLYKMDASANYESWVAVAVGEQQDVLNAKLSEALTLNQSGDKDDKQQQQPTTTLSQACGLAKRLLSSLTIEGKIEDEGGPAALEMGVVIGSVPGEEEADGTAAEGLPACVFLDAESLVLGGN